MKHLLFLVVIVLLGFSVNAQECKYEIDEVDKFTKEVTKVTKRGVLWAHLVTGNNMSAQLKLADGKKSLILRYMDPDAFKVAKGDKLIFLCSDDSTIILEADADVEARHVEKEKRWVANVNYDLSEENAAALSKSTITDLRMMHSEGHFEKAVKEERQKNLQMLSKCID